MVLSLQKADIWSPLAVPVSLACVDVPAEVAAQGYLPCCQVDWRGSSVEMFFFFLREKEPFRKAWERGDKDA